MYCVDAPSLFPCMRVVEEDVPLLRRVVDDVAALIRQKAIVKPPQLAARPTC